MITTVMEFEDDIAWEETVLNIAVPTMPLVANNTNLDLRTRTVSVQLVGFTGSDTADQLRDSLLPLMFGSAWKILDLAQELALANAGITPANRRRWTIEEKARHATSNSGVLPGFANSKVLKAIGLLYASTKETRHALVHRRIKVDKSSKALIGIHSTGSPLTPISYEEQLALIRLGQRVAQAVLEGQLRPRVEADLLSQLVTLVPHHGVSLPHNPSSRPPVKVVDAFPSDGKINFPELLKKVRETFPLAQFVDFDFALDDGRILSAELESAPQTIVAVDPAAPPPWLRLR